MFDQTLTMFTVTKYVKVLDFVFRRRFVTIKESKF